MFIQLHSLRTYWTSVFPLSLYRTESSIRQHALYKALLVIRILSKTVNKSKSKTQNRHETEPASSPQNWTSMFMNRNSVFLLCMFTKIELKVLSGSVFFEIVCSSVEPLVRANPVFKSSISNWRFNQQRFQTELNDCGYHAVKPLEQIQSSKHKSDLFATEFKPACSSIKLTGSLCPSYGTESLTEQQYIAKLFMIFKETDRQFILLEFSLSYWIVWRSKATLPPRGIMLPARKSVIIFSL